MPPADYRLNENAPQVTSTTPSPRAAGSPGETRIFNDDLLLNPGDLQIAKNRFPRLFPALDNPELRKAFLRYEELANKARTKVQRLGLAAVCLATMALLTTATRLWLTSPIHQRTPEHSAISVVAVILELCGLVAALIAVGSLGMGPWKKRWLESRFMTERLRQWHFQLLLHRADEIDALVTVQTPEAIREFEERRRQRLDAFLFDHEGKLDSRMDALAHDPDLSHDWLHDPSAPYRDDSPALPELFEVYRHLRFRHQYDYVTHKLSHASDRVFWRFLKLPLHRQRSILGGLSSFCFVAALLCAIALIVNHATARNDAVNQLLAPIASVIAIIGVAVRTIQEGLGITEDIERYQDYRGKVRRALLQFETAKDPKTRLQLMAELELAVVDELKSFLRTHGRSRFAM
jgi:hypothetical protein